MKRQMKKERAERILNEHKRLKQVLLIQNMFENLEIEQVRNDFRNGWHSAVVSFKTGCFLKIFLKFIYF